ncbi:MAG: methyltransferase domain-containing protein [Deltaproteobacteria bacterium]|nr:methyltransferase domain-containing protein [Deltaproteobacteria bacterium]
MDVIHKDISLDQIEKTFAITKQIGISIRAFYMLGIPTETREESLKTISFAKKLDATWSQFTVFTPFPGTELYDLVVKEGALKSHNWADYKTHGGWTKGGLAYVPKGRSVEEMKKLQKQAYRAVYLRPRVFIRFLRDINSIKKIKEYVIGFWVLLKTMIPSRNNHPKAVRINREDLERFAKNVYVDSPVYFSPNRLVRYINWKKLDSVLSLLLPQGRHRALDFGCGNGVMLPTLSGIFDTVVGIDLHTSAASRVIHEYGLNNVFLIRTNGVRLPFKDDAFYTVLTTSVLEHFRDLEEVVAEVARIIKPGGSLLFLSPTENIFYRCGRWLFGFKKPEDHYYSAKEIELVLKTHFTSEVKRSFPIGFLPLISVYRVGRFKKIVS